jgi:tyrosyl-tRNA synthetase
LYHGQGAGQAAQAVFDKRFKEHVVVDAQAFKAHLNDRLNDEGLVYLPKLLADAGLASSAGDGRRKLDQGGVKVNGKKLPAKSYNLDPVKLNGATLQVGKLHVVRLV